MLYLSLIFHMHQPYYSNLLSGRTEVPWVRLHGTKDYLDMVQMLSRYPDIKLTFNLVPSLIEQLEDFTNGRIKDDFFELSFKPADTLTDQEKNFIRANFFMINRDTVIAMFPRYYELYLARQAGKDLSTQDLLDLQVWFNLAWIDPYFRHGEPVLRQAVEKGRFFTEEDKREVLEAQTRILENVVPAYDSFQKSGQIEVTVSPYYHPILPLLVNNSIAREANHASTLPGIQFSHPEDARAQVDSACAMYREKFGKKPCGMWPSEMAVSEHILPFFLKQKVRWIVADEAILFRSFKCKKRDTALLYQPHTLKREEGTMAIVFRDRNLSDLIGFKYASMKASDAVNDFLGHLKNIADSFAKKDILVTVAMDGENAWEYFRNDGHEFLELLYERLAEAPYVKTMTVNNYLRQFPQGKNITRLAAGSWIFGEFSKWINNPYKNKFWEYLTLARRALEEAKLEGRATDLAIKQMHILEGSDWYWWAGEDYPGYFDHLFRQHLANFYALIDRQIPEYCRHPVRP